MDLENRRNDGEEYVVWKGGTVEDRPFYQEKQALCLVANGPKRKIISAFNFFRRKIYLIKKGHAQRNLYLLNT